MDVDSFIFPHECDNCTSTLAGAVRAVLNHHPAIKNDAIHFWTSENLGDFVLKMVSSVDLKDLLSEKPFSSVAPAPVVPTVPSAPSAPAASAASAPSRDSGSSSSQNKVSQEDREKARNIMEITQISEKDAFCLMRNHPSGGSVNIIITDFLTGGIDMDSYRKMDELENIEFSENDAFGLGEKELESARNILKLMGPDKYTPSDICCLLRHHPQSRDMGAVIATLQQGVDMVAWHEKDTLLLRKSYEVKEEECVFCFDEFKVEDMFTLDCEKAHRFCFECIERHVDISVRDGIPPLCPGNECNHKISSLEVSQIFGNGELYNKFNSLVLKRALEGLEGSIGCPSPGCTNYIVVDTAKKIRCTCPGCGLSFCSMCREMYHYGEHNCAEVKAIRMNWMQWNLKDRETVHTQEQKEALELRKEELKKRIRDLKKDEEWKEKHLRVCPRCSRTIEKTGGCDSMICGRDTHGGNTQDGCGHSFSWSKAKPYKKVNWDTHMGNVNANKISADELNKVRESHGYWNCDVCPNHDKIMGIRFSCIHCPAFNICQNCEEKGDYHHHPDHVFDIIHHEKYAVKPIDLT